MPAQLVALTEGPNILLDKPILLVGRHPECDIQIDSRKVSRQHCCIAQVSDYLVVRDLGSTNGVRINGVRVLEGKLRAGDELTIGSLRYQLRGEPIPSRSVPLPRTPATEAIENRPGTERLHDDPLESCDEPVPLVETDSSDDADIPRARRANDSHLLPDSIDLAPSSEILPGQQPGN